jgi:WD40 repeat protein
VGFDFSPDGRTLAAARGNILMAWDVATGKLLVRQESLQAQPPVVFSPDGKWLATGGFDEAKGTRFLQLIDVVTWKRAQTAAMQQSPIGNGFAFSSDGKRLALGVNAGKDGRLLGGGALAFESVAAVHVLEVPSLKLIAKSAPLNAEKEGSAVSIAGFNADGSQIVCYGDGAIRLVYDANSAQRIPSSSGPRGTHFLSRRTELVAIWKAENVADHFVVWRPGDDGHLVRWSWKWPPQSSWPAGFFGLAYVPAIDAQGKRLAVFDRIAKEIRILSLP